jgi:hypothetical protein
MTHPLLQERAEIIAKKDRIDSTLLEFAKIQHKLTREAADEAKFPKDQNGWQVLGAADRFEIDDDGCVNCWVHGRWGGEDWISGSFMLDPLILDGKNDEFKAAKIQFYKDEAIKIEAEKIEKAQKKVEETRESLLRQQQELAQKIAALGEKQ